MLLFLSTLLGTAFAAPPAPPPAYVKTVIDAHGLSAIADHSRVQFGFRGATFDVQRDHGVFRYARTAQERGVTVLDVVSNEGFEHQRAGVVTPLPEAVSRQRSNSVNSVVYFAMLPLPLADPAVRATQLEPQVIDGRSHERLSVRFVAEGGGDDHDDEYLYWFDAETQHLRFFAYRFHTGEGGVRFRVAKNERTVGGVTFFDYDNYSYVDHQVPLDQLPQLRAPTDGRPALKLLSEIVLDDVKVEPAR